MKRMEASMATNGAQEVEDWEDFEDLGLRAGNYVEILRDVNCIPAGVYKYAGFEGGAHCFSVRSHVFFAVVGIESSVLRVLPAKQGHKRRTSLEDFVTRYYALLDKVRSLPPSTTRPWTYCLLDRSVAREGRSLLASSS